MYSAAAKRRLVRFAIALGLMLLWTWLLLLQLWPLTFWQPVPKRHEAAAVPLSNYPSVTETSPRPYSPSEKPSGAPAHPPVELNSSSPTFTFPTTFSSARPLVSIFKGEPTAGEEHIIFVETSCALTEKPFPVHYDSESGLRLSARAACALEAAARAHPERPIYVLHTCSVKEQALTAEGAPPHALAALARPNVRLWVVPFSRMMLGTPVEKWWRSGILRLSPWPATSASDILRFLVIWKYGGTYLDLDVLMLKSLGEERNWGCAESKKNLACGAFNCAMDLAGRRVANACLAEMNDYRPDSWAYNGPFAITRALNKVCGVKRVSEMTSERCRGFHLLPTSAFYAVKAENWKSFFEEKDYDEVMKLINNSYAVHIWNNASRKSLSLVSSNEPLARIANKVCPNVIATVGETI